MKRVQLLPILVFATSAALGACMASPEGSGSSNGGGGNVGFGGAQDIGQFREILRSGGIPGAKTLDANGFMNEHFIALPPPTCDQPICGHAMLSVGRDWMSKDYQATLQVAMNTPVDPATLERRPLNLVVAVDTSGSMSKANRIGFVKDGLHLLIDELQEGDRLALVGYSSVAVELSRLDSSDADALHGIVNGLRASGSTNLYDGLRLAMQMVADNFDADRQNRVILLSDGLPTTGVTDTPSIIDMADLLIADGIGLTTIGVGSDFNVELMRGLAERGAGNFYFLEDSSAVTEVFSQELDFFVTPLAMDLDIRVVARRGYQLGAAVGSRAWATDASQTEGSAAIPAVFISSRTSNEPDPEGRRGGGSTLFIHLLPQLGTEPIDPGDVAELFLSYRLPGESDRREQRIAVTSPYAPNVSPEQPWFSFEAMAKNYAVYNVYLGLRSATVAAATDYTCALGILARTSAATSTWNELYGDADGDLAADISLLELFAANLRATGAAEPTTANPLDACGDNDGPYRDPNNDPYGDGYNDYDNHDEAYACSAGGSNPGAGLMLMALACLVVARRRAGSKR